MIKKLKEILNEKGNYKWTKIDEFYASKAGYESINDLIIEASLDKTLEVNEFYRAIRYLPSPRIRNIEVGRICVVTYGIHYGKKCVITDIVDQARVVIMGVKGIFSDMQPQSFPIRRLHLTNARVKGLSQRGYRLKKVQSLVNASLDDLKIKLKYDRKLKQINNYNKKKKMTDFQKFKQWAEKIGI